MLRLRRSTIMCNSLLYYSWLLILPLLVEVSGFVSFLKYPSSTFTFPSLIQPSTTTALLSSASSPSSSSSSSSIAHKPHVPNFCSNCGSANMKLQIPEGDDHLRAVCQDCQSVVYSNPKIVVACVVMVQTTTSSSTTTTTSSHHQTTNKKVLLAKRAIEPRLGYWGIPQGFMELHDTTTRTATCREVWEETGAVITPDQLRLRALYNVPGSVQLVYSVTIDADSDEKDLHLLNITNNKTTTTKESSDIGLFALDSLPDLCFPTVQWALDHCCGSSDSSSVHKKYNSIMIQQKNKLYNAESDQWSVSEDHDGP